MGRAPSAPFQRKKRSYYVIKVLTPDGDIRFVAASAGGYKKLKSQLKKEYLEKGKKWLEAKKKAGQAGKEFTESKPVKPKYRALREAASSSAALKLARGYQSKWEAKLKQKKEASKEQQEGSQKKTS